MTTTEQDAQLDQAAEPDYPPTCDTCGTALEIAICEHAYCPRCVPDLHNELGVCASRDCAMEQAASLTSKVMQLTRRCSGMASALRLVKAVEPDFARYVDGGAWAAAVGTAQGHAINGLAWAPKEEAR